MARRLTTSNRRYQEIQGSTLGMVNFTSSIVSEVNEQFRILGIYSLSNVTLAPLAAIRVSAIHIELLANDILKVLKCLTRPQQ